MESGRRRIDLLNLLVEQALDSCFLFSGPIICNAHAVGVAVFEQSTNVIFNFFR